MRLANDMITKQAPHISVIKGEYIKSVWPHLVKFLKVFSQFLSKFSNWHNWVPTLANILYFCPNFHCSKWPKFEKYCSNSPNIWWLFGLFWPWLIKFCCGYSLVNFWKNWETFYSSNWPQWQYCFTTVGTVNCFTWYATGVLVYDRISFITQLQGYPQF